MSITPKVRGRCSFLCRKCAKISESFSPFPFCSSSVLIALFPHQPHSCPSPLTPSTRLSLPVPPPLYQHHRIESRNREVVSQLIEEYRAAERPDYVTWGLQGGGGGGGSQPLSSSSYSGSSGAGSAGGHSMPPSPSAASASSSSSQYQHQHHHHVPLPSSSSSPSPHVSSSSFTGLTSSMTSRGINGGGSTVSMGSTGYDA